jgi:hypothetical protein
MTTNDDNPTRQAIAAKDRSAPMKVTGKLKHALDLMVWKGARRAAAAKQAGMTDHSLRAALKKPHVKAAYLAELQVLRESERARNIHALVEVRDGKQHSNPMARVQAAKALEGIEDPLGPGLGNPLQQPGLTINIIHPPGSQQPMVDVTPNPRPIERSR